MLNRTQKHRYCRYYRIGGMTVEVASDLPITDKTFHQKFRSFEVKEPGEEQIVIRHLLHLPDFTPLDLGDLVYYRLPWAIYRKNDSWIYLGISGDGNEFRMDSWLRIWCGLLSRQSNRRSDENQLTDKRAWIEKKRIYLLSEFNDDHTRADIYHRNKWIFRSGNIHSLSCFPTDQIFLARVLAERHGCIVHAAGVVLNDNGILFVGRSEAGKSTLVKMLEDHAKILCDDRIIVRKSSDGFKIYGTWSHGDVPVVSADSAPLKAILFLEQSQENRLIPVIQKQDALKELLGCLIKPLVGADWWHKMLILIESMIQDTPSYILCFEKSSDTSALLNSLRCLEKQPQGGLIQF